MSDTLRNIVIGTVIFSVLVLAAGIILNDTSDAYGISRNETLSGLYNKTSTVQSLSEEMSDQMLNISRTDEDAITQIAKGSFDALILAYNSLATSGDLVATAGQTLGIPPIFIGVAVTILILTGIFAIIKFRFI